MSIRTLLARALALLVLVGFAADVQAQDYRETFNTALETAKQGQAAAQSGDYDTAVTRFGEAIDQFETVSDNAAAEDDAEVARQAATIASKLAYTAGQIRTQQEQYDAAIVFFDTGIERMDTFAKNYRGRALALKKAERIEEAMEAYLLAIEIAQANSQYEDATAAREAIRDYYHYEASSRLSGETTSRAAAQEALEALQTLIEMEAVDATADTYYYMAVAENRLGNHGAAIAAADQALEAYNGGRSGAAKIHFVKGEALLAQGDRAAARSAFENANYGDYAASAQHQLEMLGG